MLSEPRPVITVVTDAAFAGIVEGREVLVMAPTNAIVSPVVRVGQAASFRPGRPGRCPPSESHRERDECVG